MIIPEAGKSIAYRYISQFLKMDLDLSVEDWEAGCKLVRLTGHLIGKYYAVIREDDENISLILWGKGSVNAAVTDDDVKNPLLVIGKQNIHDGIRVDFDNYSVQLYKSNVNLNVLNREYKDCFMLLVKYEKGGYLVSLKDGVGLISIQNIVNNSVKEEILIKEV